MKGPNPFSPYVAAPLEIKGRKTEIDIFESFLNDIASGKNRTLLVSGIRGVGKSEFLRRLQIVSERRGFFAPLVSAGRDERFSSFLSKLNSSLLGYAQTISAEGRLSNHVLVSIQRQSKEEIVEFLSSFARSAGRHSDGLILMIDDMDKLRDSKELMDYLVKSVNSAKNSHLKLGIVISYIEGSRFSSFPELRQHIRLLELDEHDIREVVESGLKKGPPKMGEECLRSVVEESSGNPFVVKTILYTIFERLPDGEKIITQRHYLTFYPMIMSALSRDLFDKLYQDLPGSEKDVLRAFAEEGKEAYISDIARKIGKRHATTLALRLVERGQLVRVDRGMYKVFTKLYGRYVMQRGI